MKGSQDGLHLPCKDRLRNDTVFSQENFVKRQSLKVQINATDDTICMRYLRASQNTRLEGFVLGYGSSFFSNQYIPLPSEGKNYVTELDAEPRYLVSVRPARVSSNKKSCSGRTKNQKPLQLIVGTLTPTSVFLSWGILVNPQHDWTATTNCASDRFYTVRYREKGKDKKWVFQLCPVTETVVDNLKPNTLYEFGVKDNLEDSIWSKTLNHKTVLSSKKVNGQLQNVYKLVPNSQTQLKLRDNKRLVPVTIIKQVIQNQTQSKTSDSSSLPGAILVHLIVPGLNETQQKLSPLLPIDDILQASTKKMAKNETRVWPAESKTPAVQEISPESLPAQAEKKHGPEEFKSTPKPKLVQTQNILASNEIQPLPSGSRISDVPKSPLTELAFEETQPISSGSRASCTTEVQPTRSASRDFLHVTSTPQILTASEIQGTGERKPFSSRSTTSSMPEMSPISAVTQRPKLKPTFPYLASQRTLEVTIQAPFKPITPDNVEVESASDETQLISSRTTTFAIPEMRSTKSATQRPELKSTSSASLKTIRTVKATRRPRLKPTTPSSLTMHQTVMASLDSYHLTFPSQIPASAEISKIETVTSSADLEKSVSPLSRTPHVLTTTTATSKSILESFTSKTSHPFQWPSVTLATKEIPLIPSKLKPSATPEAQHVKPAPKPSLLEPKASQTVEKPKTTLAPKEAKLKPSASKHRPSGRPKKPRTKPVLEPITLRIEPPRSTIVLKSVTLRTDQLKPAIVPKETQHFPSKPRTSPSSEVPQTKAAPNNTRHGTSEPKTSPSPHVPPTRASPKESRRVSSKPRASPGLGITYTKTAPQEPQHTPFKPKADPIPDAPHRKPEIVPAFQEPDTTTIPHVPERTKATLAPTEKQFIHTKPKTSEKPRVPHTKPAIRQTTPQPIITKPSTTTEHSRATMAPKETLLIPSKPRTSVGPEVPQSKAAPRATHPGSINLVTVHVVDGYKITLAPSETYQISPKAKTALATEIPRFSTAPYKTRFTSARPKLSDKSQTRQVLSRTTLAPARTKASGLPKWIVPTTDEAHTPEDIARQIGIDVQKPLEYIDNWEKAVSVTTSPGPQHPPLPPPVKPTQMRRKPLPPNTVTGKPGMPAKPAGPTTPVRTGTSYKMPTAFATPDYYIDVTVFSSSPTSETDSSGKPRYQAPHVKYMKKDDDVPCSITSSLEHFPQEEANSKEEPTRPPQNPPTNLTVVTVEGCPTFVILDWEKPDNDTVTEYEVVSTENGATDGEKEKSIITTNQTHSTVENLKPDTSYEFHVKPRNPLGEGPSSNVVAFSTESADPRVSEPISMGKDAIWTEIPFHSDTYSECKGKQYVKRTWYKKFVGVQLCNSLRYKIYLSDSLTGKFYNIGDQRGHGEDHCQFVDSFLDGRTGQQEDLPVKDGFFRAVRQEPVKFGKIGGETHINYVRWYECGTSIPGKW
ncbi:target of Nesh-SH3 isoform X1 [Melopsittacus undulatus]|uniref:target of Nesh-SH3 isoform X1 n=1 Tax=Melopsittacus undulatus TaxID=13146 RepID=UPI001243734A|nr:target of Nesh-SH3 isoform X1 [Melopsittacus undulatus]